MTVRGIAFDGSVLPLFLTLSRFDGFDGSQDSLLTVLTVLDGCNLTSGLGVSILTVRVTVLTVFGGSQDSLLTVFGGCFFPRFFNTFGAWPF